MSEKEPLLPARDGETSDEQRLREAINRHAGQMMHALDTALFLRTAPSSAQRARHMARGHMLDFGLKAMHALSIVQADKQKPD